MFGVTGGRTGPAGVLESPPSCAEETGGEDARGALPAAPTRASSARRRPPPRTRAWGGHTKGMVRRAGRGAVEGRWGPDEVAGSRRPPRPRLCLPCSAPPHRGAPPPPAPSPCSLPGQEGRRMPLFSRTLTRTPKELRGLQHSSKFLFPQSSRHEPQLRAGEKGSSPDQMRKLRLTARTGFRSYLVELLFLLHHSDVSKES
ncbi:uncharacterized protein WM277_004768 [Molossus nigricans]